MEDDQRRSRERMDAYRFHRKSRDKRKELKRKKGTINSIRIVNESAIRYGTGFLTLLGGYLMRGEAIDGLLPQFFGNVAIAVMVLGGATVLQAGWKSIQYGGLYRRHEELKSGRRK